jgi:sortase A
VTAETLSPTGTVRPAEASTAPPTRRDALPGRRTDREVTEVLPPIAQPQSGNGGRPPRPPRVPRRPGGHRPAESRALAPRDTRWWVGAALLVVAALLVGFVAYGAVFSGLVHQRAQGIAYEQLRESLAKATVPTGQLIGEDTPTPMGTPIALLHIPAIGLSEVIREGTTSTVLQEGAGHRRDSVFPGQAGTAVLLGRQLAYGGPFSGLIRLKPGDPITVTTGQGEHEYRVVGIRRAGDPMPVGLTAGQGRLELQTADGLPLFPNGILYVDAELMTKAAGNPSRLLGYAMLPAEERGMGQDPQAWFAAFFALLFLAAAGTGMWWMWTRWGRWHAWLIGVPVLLALGVVSANATMNALPNLL